MQKPIFNNLRAARNNAGLLQTEVAKKLGFTTTDRISRWEHGQGYPHMINLFKLAAIYKNPPHELYSEFYQDIQWQFSRPPAYQEIPLTESLRDN